MKRALTLALTVAVIGGLAFMGFAGTAAAQPLVDQNSSVDVDQDSSATTSISVDQDNSNSQTQTAVSFASSDKSYAKTTAVQSQDVNQANQNEIEDVYTVSANVANDNDATNELNPDINLSTGNITIGNVTSS